MSDQSIFTINEATYTTDIAAMYSALIGFHESHEVKPGVWDHVFSAPISTISVPATASSAALCQLYRMVKPPQNATQLKHSRILNLDKLMAQCRREHRWKKIKRRQIHAAQRRTRKGLA